MNNSNLEFRKVPSLKFLYEINENGTILRNVKSKKQLKIKLDMHHSNTGYYISMIHSNSINNGKVKRVKIHRLVAECWLGPCPENMEVDHIDRNSRNNDYRNLRYVDKSTQMKNRDYSNINKIGSKNLEKARKLRMKPVLLNDEYFESYATAARFLEEKTNLSFEAARNRLKAKRKRILEYDVTYLNAETIHTRSTEQEIVHFNNDLTGDYKTAFNEGKQSEVEERVKHTGIEVEA